MSDKTKKEYSKVFNRCINIGHPDHFSNSQITIKHVFIAFILLVSIITIIVTGFTTSRVDGSSMFPTLHDEDFLLVHKYRFWNSPERGDIISSRLEAEYNGEMNDKVTVVKRIIGLPGEIVEFKNRRFQVINPQLGYIKFKEEYLIDPMLTPSWDGNMRRFLVPKDHYFVLGDNREISEDSRDYGTIPEDNIIGEVTYKIPAFFEIKETEYEFQTTPMETVKLNKMFEEKRKEAELLELEKIEEMKKKEELEKEEVENLEDAEE